MSSDEESEQAKSLFQSFKKLGVVPKFENPGELKDWMASYVKQSEPDVEHSGTTQPPMVNAPVAISHTKPRLSTFSGPTPLTKGDVSYDQWYYEVRCTLLRGIYSKDSIMEAVQLSLRGEPKEIAMRLGPQADLHLLLEKLKHVYDRVDDEVLLASFYSASQHEDEDCTKWAFRLEGIINKLEDVHLMTTAKKDRMLRTRYYNGLQPALRDVTGHKFDRCTNFEELWMAIRDIEDKRKKITSSTSKETQSKAQVKMISSNKPEDTSLHSLVQQLVSKVERLERSINKEQDKTSHAGTRKDYQQTSQQHPEYQDNYSNVTPRYNYSGYQYQPRLSRGSGYQHGSRSYQQPQQRYHYDRQCYKCGQFGHIAIGCCSSNLESPSRGGRGGHLNYRRSMRQGQS